MMNSRQQNLPFPIFFQLIYNLYRLPMKYLITCIVFLSTLTIIHGTNSCAVNSDCAIIIPSSYSFCNSQNICQCQATYIFNCTSPAITLYTGVSTLYLQPNSITFYLISNYVDQALEYLLTLTDRTKTDMIRNYSIFLFIDNGFNTLPDIPTATIVNGGNQLNIDVEIKLGTMPGTNIPQSLVMGVQNKQNILGQVMFNFRFASTGNSNTLLIVAYAGGGVCLCVTLTLMILVYRKRRNETNPSQRQNNQPVINNISHFDDLMPLSNISVQHRKDGRVCSVCLQEFEITSIIRTTICGHIFHSSCIDEWCAKNLICPMCRTDLSSNNILLLRMKNNKQDNNSSWIVNSIDQDAPDVNEEVEANQAMNQFPSNVDRLNQPLLEAQDSNRVALIGNDQL